MVRESEMTGMLARSRMIAERAVGLIYSVISLDPETFLLVIEFMGEYYYEHYLGKKSVTFQCKVGYREDGKEDGQWEKVKKKSTI